MGKGRDLILRGTRVLLRRGRGGDVDRLTQIRSEPEVSRWWGDFAPEEINEEFIDSECAYVIEFEGEVVGAIQFSEETDPMYRHAGIDIFLTCSRRGQGLGAEAIRVLARHLFEDRGHHRLTIDPAADNRVAIGVYERVGFRTVGVMRQYEQTPDGNWRDGLLMEMLKQDFTEDSP